MFPAESQIIDTIATDSIAVSDTDSIGAPAADSLRQWGIVLARTHDTPEDRERPEISTFSSDSWVLAPLMLIFVIIAVRYRSNTRYVKTLLQDMSSVRERGNVFDDTVRETSFLILLNLLWICSGGILLCSAVGGSGPLAMGLCAAIVGVYTLVMMTGYYLCGLVFTDARHARMWTRGFASGQGVGSILLFALALLDVCYHNMSEEGVICALIVLIIVKIVFIWQGFRIFFSQCGSLLLFLYYLCSLEIVPLILSYVAAGYVCDNLL